jgi:hypothetical protein
LLRVQLVADYLDGDGGSRVPDVDPEQRGHRLELLPGRTVLDRPADVRSHPGLDAALGDERGQDDETAIAERESVVRPPARSRVDCLRGHPLAQQLPQMVEHLALVELELARVGRDPAGLPLLGIGWTGGHGRHRSSQPSVSRPSGVAGTSTGMNKPLDAGSSAGLTPLANL